MPFKKERERKKKAKPFATGYGRAMGGLGPVEITPEYEAGIRARQEREREITGELAMPGRAMGGLGIPAPSQEELSRVFEEEQAAKARREADAKKLGSATGAMGGLGSVRVDPKAYASELRQKAYDEAVAEVGSEPAKVSQYLKENFTNDWFMKEEASPKASKSISTSEEAPKPSIEITAPKDPSIPPEAQELLDSTDKLLTDLKNERAAYDIEQAERENKRLREENARRAAIVDQHPWLGDGIKIEKPKPVVAQPKKDPIAEMDREIDAMAAKIPYVTKSRSQQADEKMRAVAPKQERYVEAPEPERTRDGYASEYAKRYQAALAGTYGTR